MASEQESFDSDSEKREARSESFKYDHISQFSQNFLAKTESLKVEKPVEIQPKKNAKFGKIAKKNLFHEGKNIHYLFQCLKIKF